MARISVITKTEVINKKVGLLDISGSEGVKECNPENASLNLPLSPYL